MSDAPLTAEEVAAKVGATVQKRGEAATFTRTFAFEGFAHSVASLRDLYAGVEANGWTVTRALRPKMALEREKGAQRVTIEVRAAPGARCFWRDRGGERCRRRASKSNSYCLIHATLAAR